MATHLLSEGMMKRSSILVKGHSNIVALDAFGQEKKKAKVRASFMDVFFFSVKPQIIILFYVYTMC